ncbi:MAG TPA: HAD-IIIC family phosphatase [Flavobacteriales bacterium]|nr:HAD-IIIC family phosphatase [Flavobacteriales bacterium]
MLSFSELKRNLKKDTSSFKKLEIAILGDSSTQFLTQAIKGYGIEHKLNLSIYDAPYNQLERQLSNKASELYTRKPSFIFLFLSPQKIISSFYSLSKSEQASFADDYVSRLEQHINIANSELSANFIITNIPEINDQVFGNYGNKNPYSLIFQIRKLNYELMRLCSSSDNLFINDVASLSNRYGYDQAFSSSLYINGDIIYHLDFLPTLAKNSVDILRALSGSVIKCVVLDLDNTMWGGIIGDDGIDNIQLGELGIGKAFTEFQRWIKQLKNRGILLAVCSKNNDSTAREVFEKHPDMVLRLEDITIFIANWENKAANISAIRENLNIGFDSMVFLDDSAFERNLVRELIPDIIVPELPEDPSEYLAYLQHLNLFESISFTAEDENRTQMYREDFNRTALKKVFLDEDDYLRNLELKMNVETVNDFNLPRIAQLIQRSNQFNFRTMRYSPEEIKTISTSPTARCYSFSLEDKHGKYGLISTIILRLDKTQGTAFIDSWVMSCRVLNRGVEDFILNFMMECLEQEGLNTLQGEFIPTAKNSIVKELYAQKGFQPDGNLWIRKLSDYQPITHFIARTETVA